MNTRGIDERAGDEHLLHTPRKWVRTEKDKARERARIAQEREDARVTVRRRFGGQDQATILQALGLQRRRGPNGEPVEVET